MELLIGLVVIAVLALMAFGLFGLTFIGWGANKDAQALEQEPQILDALFDGNRHVTYRAGAIGALPFEKVVVGGIERGYALTHDSSSGGTQVLIFELTDPELVPEAQPITAAAQGGGSGKGGRWPASFIIGAAIVIGALIIMVAVPDGFGPGLALLIVGGFLIARVAERLPKRGKRELSREVR